MNAVNSPYSLGLMQYNLAKIKETLLLFKYHLKNTIQLFKFSKKGVCYAQYR